MGNVNMTELMEHYKLNFDSKYDNIYSFAVRSRGEEECDRRLIQYIDIQREQLAGQRQMLSAAGADPRWLAAEEERAEKTFDSHRLFGIVLSSNGHIYGGDSAGRLQVRDEQAWERAEERIARLNQAKAEAKRREHPPLIR